MSDEGAFHYRSRQPKTAASESVTKRSSGGVQGFAELHGRSTESLLDLPQARAVEWLRAIHVNALHVFLVAILVVSLVAWVFYFPFVVDDAYIVARYAENFIDSGSLVFNQGEPVSALTSPLHALLEALLYRLIGDTLTSYKIVALLLLLASALLIALTFRKNGYALLMSLSILLLPPCILLWTFGGLETPLLLFLITALSVLVYLTDDFTWPRLLLIELLVGLAFVARFDSILFTAPLALSAVLRGKRPGTILTALLVGTAIPLLWMAISVYYYGDVLPTSFYVKKPTFDLELMRDNAIYIAQYLVFVGLIPFALFLFFSSQSKQELMRQVRARTRSLWWLYLGILLMLAYGLLIATIHMMYSFRFFVPYIPAAIIVLADMVTKQTEAMSGGVVKVRFTTYFYTFLTIILALQVLQETYTYKYSINPVLVGVAEFNRVGIESSNEILQSPPKLANDIRRHWEILPKSKERAPRIYTFAGGILPYSYKGAYIYESLISYRHHCEYNLRLSADYINMLSPLHGSVVEQLPKPINHYQLISAYPLMFEGRAENYMAFYDPDPEPNRLPATVSGDCR